jgi:hypothetical protein
LRWPSRSRSSTSVTFARTPPYCPRWQQKGVILLHDIHQQSVRALSPIVEEMARQNYTFLDFDKGQFVKSSPPLLTDRAAAMPVPVSPVSDAPRKLP